MATRAITTEDLLKQRIDITKEQADARHEQYSRIQEVLINYQDNLENKIDKYFDESKTFHKDILDRLDKLEDKFAGKWTEKILIFIGWLVLTAIIWAIMTLIIIK